jgi:hypothetical protein
VNNYHVITFVLEEASLKTGRDPVPEMYDGKSPNILGI